MATAVLIGSARIDENGKISGGNSGDQTGIEVSTQPFYLHKKGWNIIRPKDSNLAIKLSKSMNDACSNNNIGYDQSNRLSVITMLNKHKSLSEISEKCEADCSSLVRACCIESGFDPGNFTTASAVNALLSTGRFSYAGSAREANDCKTGDILCTKVKGHIVIVVSVTTGNASDVKNTETLIINNNSEKKVFAKNRDSELSGAYFTTSELNLRTGPDTKYSILEELPKGTKCQCFGYYTTTKGVNWLYVMANGKTGFVSSKYLTR